MSEELGMNETLPKYPARGRVLDANLNLLDRSIEDVDGRPAAFVADIELRREGDDLVIADLIAASGLLQRFFGGHTPSSLLRRFAWHDVAEIGTRVVLGISAEDHVVTWPERWVRDHLIARIPGGRHEP